MCPCLSATDDVDDRLDLRCPDGNISLDGLIAIRDQCPVLKKVLLPDSVWPKFLRLHHPDDAASHESMILLAFVRGVLPRITLPVHRYMMAGSDIAPDATKQYLADIQEKWMFAPDPSKRNRLSRTFRGRVAELQFAAHLEDLGHRVIGMEATGHNADIETISDSGQTAFEVKALGQADEDFFMQMGAINGKSFADSVSLPEPMNYLLARVYEAALQLCSTSGKRRKAIVIVDQISWRRFKVQLKNDWIDWTNPKFIGGERDWGNVISLLKQPPQTLRELGEVIHTLGALEIFQQNHKFEFLSEKKIPFRGKPAA